MDPSTDSNEGTPLVQAALKEKDVYRFSPARKKVSRVVSVTGVMLCMSVSGFYFTIYDNISSVCNRNIHSPHPSNCEGLKIRQRLRSQHRILSSFMKLKLLDTLTAKLR